MRVAIFQLSCAVVGSALAMSGSVNDELGRANDYASPSKIVVLPHHERLSSTPCSIQPRKDEPAGMDAEPASGGRMLRAKPCPDEGNTGECGAHGSDAGGTKPRAVKPFV